MGYFADLIDGGLIERALEVKGKSKATYWRQLTAGQRVEQQPQAFGQRFLLEVLPLEFAVRDREFGGEPVDPCLQVVVRRRELRRRLVEEGERCFEFAWIDRLDAVVHWACGGVGDPADYARDTVGPRAAAVTETAFDRVGGRC